MAAARVLVEEKISSNSEAVEKYENVATVFNNDHDNSAGLGVGDDLHYVETSEGKLIECGGVEGRYVRLFSRGSHIDAKNHYTEVEVYGTPASCQPIRRRLKRCRASLPMGPKRAFVNFGAVFYTRVVSHSVWN